MDIYLAGTPVTLLVPMQDRAGNALVVDSVDYRVVDQDGLELIARVTLDTFSSGDTQAAVEVPALLNNVAPLPAVMTTMQIDTFSVRGSRTVELFLLIGGNTVAMNKSYALEPTDPLVVGVNSFQTYAQSDLTSLDVPNIVGWDAAGDKDRIAALIDARNHICQLNFWMLNSNVNWGQDNLNFIPEGSYQTPYATGGNRMFIFTGNIALLTPAQFVLMPARFKTALRLAQIAEADEILGGDQAGDLRKSGLISEEIGQTRQQYRAGKPLDLPVSKRALRYLSQFVSMTKKIGRA